MLLEILSSMSLPNIVAKYRQSLPKAEEASGRKRKRINILPVLLKAFGPSVAGGITIKVMQQ